MNAWVGIISTIVGAFLACGAAWLNSRSQLRHQAERDRKKLILEKLEEIHELLSTYKQSYNMLTAACMRAHESGQVEFAEFEPIPSERLKMLVGFYAPGLERSLKNIEDQS
jgi:hypothetical protein